MTSPFIDPTPTTVLPRAVAVLDAPAVELTDEQADWLIQRIEWSAGFGIAMSRQFFEAFGVGVELGVRDEFREDARAAVRKVARLG